MGGIGSFLQGDYHIIDLVHTVHTNDIRALRRRIRHSNSTCRNIKLLLFESIRKERREVFDMILEKFKILTDHIDDFMKSEYFEKCFAVSVSCTDSYFVTKFLEVCDSMPVEKKSILLHVATLSENEDICHELLLKGADVNFIYDGTIPLERAIRYRNINLICMFLYYDSCVKFLEMGLYFMPSCLQYCIIYNCNEEIQKILFNYEDNFNAVHQEDTLLFSAIKYNSPLTLDIIEQGADVNHFNGIHNSVLLAIIQGCDSNFFRVIWDLFDYKIWKLSYSKSVLNHFLERYCGREWAEYLYIFMEDGNKLQLDLECHNNSQFYKSDPLISKFYLRCLEKDIDESVVESFVFCLLSHGAAIFEKDVDIIYQKLGAVTPFLQSLLYMDLQRLEGISSNIMYFKYTPVPDIGIYLLNNVRPEDILRSLKYINLYYAFDADLKMQVLDTLGSEHEHYEDCKKIFDDECVAFPSLLQLSRDSARRLICSKYGINNSCKLYTIIKHFNLPGYIQNILLLDICLYNM